VSLSKITSDHFPILLRGVKSSQVDDHSNLKICGLRWMAFVTLPVLFGMI